MTSFVNQIQKIFSNISNSLSNSLKRNQHGVWKQDLDFYLRSCPQFMTNELKIFNWLSSKVIGWRKFIETRKRRKLFYSLYLFVFARTGLDWKSRCAESMEKENPENNWVIEVLLHEYFILTKSTHLLNYTWKIARIVHSYYCLWIIQQRRRSKLAL